MTAREAVIEMIDNTNRRLEAAGALCRLVRTGGANTKPVSVEAFNALSEGDRYIPSKTRGIPCVTIDLLDEVAIDVLENSEEVDIRTEVGRR